MILQLPLVSLFSRFRSDSSAPSPVNACVSSRATSFGYRLIKISLAIYLIPALLIVLLVGALGVLILGVVRFFSRLLDAKSD
jgi:hypothetical protein